ncbi:MAG: hypothetical protein NWQ54_20235 [Paraglaciecola sp.]|uniref:DUF4397 domain-containing protein n=1 Tax=Paraglaciecola sp. TaxID=1920173 RepID=UPI00273E0CCF|nr:DUF4397 domain-containing protein [Paraglaciecola sp.]MDP5032352.1 hypothetical protein [Paraglaciecola sp.]MDP5133216.1 hypothetical protein [Paraglaciecola sp.]
MKFNRALLKPFQPMVYVAILMFGLTACGSGGSDDDSTGYIKFYNASANAPGVFLTVDENLDEDDDDEVEVTYNSVAYTKVSATNALDKGTYYIELAWQDEESSARSDLEIIYEDSVKIKNDQINFIALTGDVRQPEVLQYEIEVVDDDNDDDDDLFNIRLLNLHGDYQNVDLYMSKDNETFNEAVLVGTANYQALSDNIKVEQDQYIYYITLAGSSDVIYTSVDQNYSAVSQYIIVLRENTGVGSSPFTIDSIGVNGVTELEDVDSEAQFSFYNGIALDDYLPTYFGDIDIEVRLDGESEVKFTQVQLGEFTSSTTTSNGDYDFYVRNSQTNELYVTNALLSLEENADNTLFLYGKRDPIDDDEDGDVDENSDGIVDGYETKVKTLTVTKSSSSSIYSHGIKLVNLADSDDFSRVTFYFVLSDEIISSADNKLSVLQENSASITLLNNTYSVYAIATIDGTEIKLANMQLILDEDSKEQYLIFEAEPSASSGYKMTLINQRSAD